MGISTKDYHRLAETTGDYWRLPQTPRDYKRLPKITRNFRRQPYTTGDYQRSQKQGIVFIPLPLPHLLPCTDTSADAATPIFQNMVVPPQPHYQHNFTIPALALLLAPFCPLFKI